ncbi:MAG TPA: metallophosphoesterase [Phycisphaerae bacterium]|nr:metallophosphoesterase [Phycisphaerae bacterium]
MKLGILADTHDNLETLSAALQAFRRAGAEAILHAGDYVAPFALKRLLEPGLPVYGVFGNCDGERAGLTKLLPDIAPGPRHLELGGRKICLVHVRETLSHEDAEASDIIIFGHTHEPLVHRDEGRLVLNPGECGGWVTGRSTAAVLDTQAMDAEILEPAATHKARPKRRKGARP